MDVRQSCRLSATSPEPERLARRDQLILRLAVARRRHRLAQQTADRLRPALLARLSG
jgi:hypothetical protein